jgi:uncharacterized protein (TIGR02597 family)
MPQFSGTVSAKSGNEITVNGSPTWTLNQWATASPNGYLPYYVQVTSNAGGGTYSGAYYTILSNDVSGDLFVGFANSGLASDNDLAGINAGDYVNIFPFWTLGSVFTNGQGYVASTGTTTGTRRTQILFPNLSFVGENPPTATSYYFFNNGWRRFFPTGANPASNFNDAVIAPDQYVTVRNVTNATDVTTFMGIGQVVTYPVRIPLFASAPPAIGQDNVLGIYRPAVQTFAQSGLSNAVLASTATTTLGRRDQVLLFDNTQQGQNKGVSQGFYYFNNGWRRFFPTGTSPAVDFSQSNVFLTTQGFFLRKATNGVSVSTLTTWVNQPNY